ncbi:MAG: peptidoglycan DD-metalloendopeptidase family protein [Clostridia bacterium]
MRNKILCTLLALVLILSYSATVIANSEIINKGNLKGKELDTTSTDMFIAAMEQDNTNTQNNQSSNTEKNQATDNTIDNLNQQKEEVEEKINQSSLQLEYIQNEMSNTMIQIQKLDDSIRSYEAQINDLNNKVNSYEESIKSMTKELEETTKEYNEKDEIVRKRLVAISKAGEVSYLDVLLRSKSLPDFLSSIYFMRQITEVDIDTMNEVYKKKEEISLYKQKIENENAQTKIIKAKAEQMSIVLNNTRSLQQGYVNSLQENEKKLNDEITAYKNEQLRIEMLIMQISTTPNVNIQFTGGYLICVAVNGTVITSPYGYREHPIQGVVKLHQGLDIGGASFGAPIVAALDGIVSYAGELGSYGNCVMIDHGNGITTLYAHGQKILTEKGKVVKQGDLIMEVGSTGNSTGPHCHFEVRVNGYTQDPLKYVNPPQN